MIKIKLNYNNAYEWVNDKNNYVIGYANIEGNTLNAQELLQEIKKIDKETDIEKIVKKINGQFGIVKKTSDGSIYLITSIALSFPIFYQVKNKEIIITDDIRNFPNKELNEFNVKELAALRVCSNNKTVYNNIYQVPSSTIVKIDKETNINEIEYFKYVSQKRNTHSKQELFKEMHEKYTHAIQRLIARANNRTIVVPLSGGYDSRLIVCLLKENNYNNVICYTYGKKNNPEYISAKKVSEYLGYPLYFIEYRSKEMRKKYYNKEEYSKMCDYFGRGVSTPHIQEWIAVEELIKRKIIDSDCIVAPGFLGDFLVGGEIKDDELVKNEYNTTNNLKNYILQKSYVYNRYDQTTKKMFEKEITKCINEELNDEKKKIEEITQLLEIFDLKERETKYIANAVRDYDYYCLKWHLVYAEYELMEFFKDIQPKIKIDRKFYKEYIKYQYKELLKHAPIAQKKQRVRKKYNNTILKTWNRIMIVLESYSKNVINLYGYFKIRDYLKYCIQKDTNIISMFNKDYIRYLKNNTK